MNDSSPVDDGADPIVGRTLGGKFLVEEFVGGGGMGGVYRAQQVALDRAVAIKVLRRGFASDPSFAARFHREAKAASRLDHPNLVRVLDFGEEADGLLYIAMEFLPGRDLLAVIDQDWPLSRDRIVDLVSQTLAGLADAHDAGILHRDLKPENIMVSRRTADDGSTTELVKVCDFGVAKILGADAPEGRAGAPARRLSTAGLVVGTPEYMSPEQARGEPLDVRSDLYAIGVVLYQLLSGRLPFEGGSAFSVALKVQRDEPPPLAPLGGTTAAPDLEPICFKAMSKRREDRYASARELRAAVRGAPAAPEGARGASSSSVPLVAEIAAPPRLAPTTTTSPRTLVQRKTHVRSSTVLAALGVVATMSTREQPLVSTMQVSTPSPSATTTLVTEPLEASHVAPAPVPSPETSGPAFATVVQSSPTLRTSRSPSPLPRRPLARPAPRETTTEAFLPSSADVDPAHEAAPPPAPVRESSPAVEASRPAPTAYPAPTSPRPASPSFDPRTASVELGRPRSNSAAASAMQIGRAIPPLAAGATECYRAALAAGVEATGEGMSTLHLETDDQGYVVLARVAGPAPARAAECIEAFARHRVRIAVDTGTASADVPLILRAQ